MKLRLDEHTTTFIRDQIATGRYVSAAEVVRDALRHFEDQVLHQALHDSWAEGNVDDDSGALQALKPQR